MLKQVCLSLAVACCLISIGYGETTCVTHKRTSTSGGLMQWDIQCDPQGNYKPLQCTKDKVKWCTCYNKDKAISSPSRGTKSCECHLAKDAIATRANCRVSDTTCRDRANAEALVCARSGAFEAKQCNPTNGKCKCVDPRTGQETVAPTNNVALKCP